MEPLKYNPWVPSKLSEKQSKFLESLLKNGKLNKVEEHSVRYTLEKGEYNEGQRILFLQLRIKRMLDKV